MEFHFHGRNLLSQTPDAAGEIVALCYSDRRWHGRRCGCSCSSRRLFSGQTEEYIIILLLLTLSDYCIDQFILSDVCLDQVTLLESRDRLGGRIHTDYSFGFPVDLGASWYDLGVTLYRYRCS